MKQKDIALVVIIVALSAMLSLFISTKVFNSPKQRSQQVEVVQPISADFPTPDTHYFNKDAFDPTRFITIEQSNNADPFSGH